MQPAAAFDLNNGIRTELEELGYTLVRELTTNQQGTARVWLTEHTNESGEREKHAVKVSSSLMGSLSGVDSSGLEQLADREAEIYRRIADNPHIPQFKLFRKAVLGGFVPIDILAVQYIESQNLLQRIKDERTISEKEAKSVLDDVLTALVHIHTEIGEQVLHRDIKPSNILFDGEHAYLFDFNFSKIGDATRGSRFIENVYYPLDAFSSRQTQSQDLVALGNVVISAGYGREVEAVRMMQGKDVLTSVDVENLPYSQKMKNFLRKLTTSNPALRYQSAAQALEVLRSLDRIREEELTSSLSSIVRSKGMQGLLSKLQEKDFMFDYNVPSNLRTELDDDALLEHLRRTYTKTEFVIEDPKYIVQYVHAGDVVVKRGAYREVRWAIRKGREGYVRAINGQNVEVSFYNGDGASLRSSIDVADLLVIGKEGGWKDTRFETPLPATTYAPFSLGLKVRYDCEQPIEELSVFIPDGSRAIVSRVKREKDQPLEVLFERTRDQIGLYRYTDKPSFSRWWPTSDFTLVRRNSISFQDLYQSCFAAEPKPVVRSTDLTTSHRGVIGSI